MPLRANPVAHRQLRFAQAARAAVPVHVRSPSYPCPQILFELGPLKILLLQFRSQPAALRLSPATTVSSQLVLSLHSTAPLEFSVLWIPCLGSHPLPYQLAPTPSPAVDLCDAFALGWLPAAPLLVASPQTRFLFRSALTVLAKFAALPVPRLHSVAIPGFAASIDHRSLSDFGHRSAFHRHHSRDESGHLHADHRDDRDDRDARLF